MSKSRLEIMIEIEKRITGYSEIESRVKDQKDFESLNGVIEYMDKYHIPYIPEDNLKNKPYEELSEFIDASSSSIITENKYAHTLAVHELCDCIAALSTGVLTNSITQFYVDCIVDEANTIFQSFMHKAKFDIDVYEAMLYKLTEICFAVDQYRRVLDKASEDNIDRTFHNYALIHYSQREIINPKNRLKIIKDFRKVLSGLIMSGFMDDYIDGDKYEYMRRKLIK